MRTGNNKGFTLIELLIVVAIIGIIAAIAVPGLLRARIAGNEASAIGSLRAINSANLNWMTNCAGGRGYADSLGDLGVAAELAAASRSSALTSRRRARSPRAATTSPTRRSARAIAGITTCSSVTTATPVYDASAAPSAPNTTGVRYFGTNENNTVFEDGDATPGGGRVRRDRRARRPTARQSSKTSAASRRDACASRHRLPSLSTMQTGERHESRRQQGLHADRAADRRGHHRHHRGDRGARPASRPYRGERSVGHRLASRHQQREPQLDDQLRGRPGLCDSLGDLGVPPTQRRPAVHQPRPLGDGHDHARAATTSPTRPSARSRLRYHDVLVGHTTATPGYDVAGARRRRRTRPACASSAPTKTQTLFEDADVPAPVGGRRVTPRAAPRPTARRQVAPVSLPSARLSASGR